jgi:arylformamidase
MDFTFRHNGKGYTYNRDTFFDLSTPIKNGADNVNAYYLDDPKFEAFRAGSFVGSVEQGGACNCETITFNAHGNGTHTECVGHISAEGQTINQCLQSFQFFAHVIEVQPVPKNNGDLYIPVTTLDDIDLTHCEALVVKTMPNLESKRHKRYSGTNPTYFDPLFMAKLAENNVLHVIVDLPSVDREEDEGHLLAHHAFWSYPASPRENATITELALIPDNVASGNYLLHLHIAAFESDASPSKPILYPLTEL